MNTYQISLVVTVAPGAAKAGQHRVFTIAMGDDQAQAIEQATLPHGLRNTLVLDSEAEIAGVEIDYCEQYGNRVPKVLVSVNLDTRRMIPDHEELITKLTELGEVCTGDDDCDDHDVYGPTDKPFVAPRD